MENYTLGLALFDYLPVIAAGFGLYLICKYCGSTAGYAGPWIIAIPAIALTGGTLKASWKLIWALEQVNIKWMSDQLFFFLASAYVLMTVFIVQTLRAGKRGEHLAANWWMLPMTFVTAMVAGAAYLMLTTDGRSWNFMLLGVLSLANLVFLIALIAHSFQMSNRLAATAFIANLVLGYVLVGLARLEQTAELQWIEEILNLTNNTVLALGAWSLIRRSQDA